MNPDKYPHQIDCVWLASDNEGFLAAFVSAGIAPIPTVALEMLAPQVEDIEGLVHALARTSTARLLASVKRPDSFRQLAERGLFVYDWQDIHRNRRDEIGAYELVAEPMTPLRADALPATLSAVAAALQFDGVRFAEQPQLDARQQMACTAGR